jgi:hypothetical protein
LRPGGPDNPRQQEGHIFRKAFVSAAAITAIAAAAPASAAYVFGAAGASHTIDFIGIINDNPLDIVPGLTSQLVLTLTGFSGSLASFDYKVVNNSTLPTTDSRVSVFGFDVIGGVTVAGSSATGVFNTVTGPPPGPPIIDNRDICFSAGPNCAGGGGGGVNIGLSTTGTLTLNLGGNPTSVTIDNPFVRYQSIAPAYKGQTSAVGIPGVIPEPATWAMLILGFGLIGASLRRRRGTTHVAA